MQQKVCSFTQPSAGGSERGSKKSIGLFGSEAPTPKCQLGLDETGIYLRGTEGTVMRGGSF